MLTQEHHNIAKIVLKLVLNTNQSIDTAIKHCSLHQGIFQRYYCWCDHVIPLCKTFFSDQQFGINLQNSTTRLVVRVLA